jgi:hypothetical protein
MGGVAVQLGLDQRLYDFACDLIADADRHQRAGGRLAQLVDPNAHGYSRRASGAGTSSTHSHHQAARMP